MSRFGKRVGRISHKDTLRGNDRAQRHLAIMHGMDAPPAELLNNVPPKRERAAPRPSGVPLEKDILRDILKMLRKHPHVARVERKQSGVFKDGDRYIRVGQRGEPDIGGILKGGRAFGIEVKRPGLHPTDIQWKRIYEIRNAGGIAGCAHSVDEALAIISGVRGGI